jgi:hypothetical protein
MNDPSYTVINLFFIRVYVHTLAFSMKGFFLHRGGRKKNHHRLWPAGRRRPRGRDIMLHTSYIYTYTGQRKIPQREIPPHALIGRGNYYSMVTPHYRLAVSQSPPPPHRPPLTLLTHSEGGFFSHYSAKTTCLSSLIFSI